MERFPHKVLAFSAALGLSLALAACGSNHPIASGASTTPTASASAAPPTSTPSAPTSPSPATLPSATASPTATPASSLPGVVADCLSNFLPSVRPAFITLACADNGWGVEKMHWTTWTASSATGQGTFWEKLCKPNCASGGIGYYPVMVTLSSVETSSLGPWFSRLNIVWEGAKPPYYHTPDQFPLMRPSSS